MCTKFHQNFTDCSEHVWAGLGLFWASKKLKYVRKYEFECTECSLIAIHQIRDYYHLLYISFKSYIQQLDHRWFSLSNWQCGPEWKKFFWEPPPLLGRFLPLKASSGHRPKCLSVEKFEAAVSLLVDFEASCFSKGGLGSLSAMVSNANCHSISWIIDHLLQTLPHTSLPSQ